MLNRFVAEHSSLVQCNQNIKCCLIPNIPQELCQYIRVCIHNVCRELVIAVLEDCVDQLAILGNIMPVADKPSAATDVSTLHALQVWSTL